MGIGEQEDTGTGTDMGIEGVMPPVEQRDTEEAMLRQPETMPNLKMVPQSALAFAAPAATAPW